MTRRYAIDARKVERELGCGPRNHLPAGFAKPWQWYLDHEQLGAEHYDRRLRGMDFQAICAVGMPKR